jgi:hypothetical protein
LRTRVGLCFDRAAMRVPQGGEPAAPAETTPDAGIRRVGPVMRAVFFVGSILVTLAGIQLFILSDHTDEFFA